MIPLRYGLGNVDWQQRINWEELRERRVEKANQFMAKYGIGAALVYNHDRKRYLTGVWNHPYERAIPGTFCLLIRDNGFPYVPVETHLVMTKAAEMTLAYETDLKVAQVRALANVCYPVADVGAPISSGSFPTLGMVVSGWTRRREVQSSSTAAPTRAGRGSWW